MLGEVGRDRAKPEPLVKNLPATRDREKSVIETPKRGKLFVGKTREENPRSKKGPTLLRVWGGEQRVLRIGKTARLERASPRGL